MKKFLILTIIAIFGIPLAGIIPIPGQAVWYGQYLGLLFFMCAGIAFFLWGFNKYLAIFNGICLLSTYFVTMMHPRAIMLLLQFNLACLVAYGISKFNTNHRRKILYAIMIFLILQSLWLVLQANNIPIKIRNCDLTFDSKLNPGTKEMVGLSGSPDQLGSFFAITFPVTLHIFPPLASLSIAGLITSKSSFAFISGIISGLFYLIFTKKYSYFIILPLMGILIFGFFLKADKLRSADFGTRLNVWKHAVISTTKGYVRVARRGRNLQVTTNPFYGFGFSNFLRIFPYIPQKETDNKFNYFNEKFTHAHNDYAEIFFELGYIGGAALLVMLGNFIYTFIKWKIILKEKAKEMTLYFSCVLAYLLNCIGNFCSHIAVSGMLLILFYGMFCGTVREARYGT